MPPPQRAAAVAPEPALCCPRPTGGAGRHRKGAYVLAEPGRGRPEEEGPGGDHRHRLRGAAGAARAGRTGQARSIAVRVVSMPSTTVFDRQDVLQEGVLPAGLPRVAVEAGVTDGWWKYGCAAVVGIDRYGESAPAPVLFKHFGFTAENVADTVRKVQKEEVTFASNPQEIPFMTIKVGINGFGRIGRMVFRAAVQNFPGHRDRRHQRPARARLPGLHAEVRQRARPLQGRHRGGRQHLVVNGKKIRLTASEGPGRAEVGRGRRRRGGRVHRPVPDQGNLPEAHRRRREEGHHVRARPARTTRRCSSTASTTRPTPARPSSATPAAPPTAWPRWPRCSTTASASSAA
jgi:hypothetical protein